MLIDEAKYPYLFKAKTPDDLRKLPVEELPKLCGELRTFLLESVSRSSGHLSSGLGVVELTVALHYVYETPIDSIVWDVGHQAYPHKILTGRAEQLDTIRQKNGLHPFPWREESEYDCVSVGHASTSVGMALALSVANSINGSSAKSVAVIGDGAVTGGMALEAFNHAGGLKSDMLVVLNDNENSISESVGAVSTTMSKILLNRAFSGARDKTYEFLKRFPAIRKLAEKTEEHIKGMVMPGTLFEEFGFEYVGPVNGHNVVELVSTLTKLRRMTGPRILHVVTQKGRGYVPAENDPTLYHGVPAFSLDKGLPESKSMTYSKVFGEFLLERAVEDEKMVAITPAMRDGSGMKEFAAKHPDRFFDVAIAEQHAVTFAGGLALGGVHPIVCVYSSFLQRSYDQLIHDIAIQKAPVVIAIDRAGVVGADGPTHQGQFDIAFMLSIPGIDLMAPSCFEEMRRMLRFACELGRPVAIRYPRGGEKTIDACYGKIEYGKAQKILDGSRVVILSYGALLAEAIEAGKAIGAEVIDLRFARPLDEKMILSAAVRCPELVVTLEDGSAEGGVGTRIASLLMRHGLMVPVINLGLPETYLEQGKPCDIYADCGLNAEGIISTIKLFLGDTEFSE